jgi:hypothetical protein
MGWFCLKDFLERKWIKITFAYSFSMVCSLMLGNWDLSHWSSTERANQIFQPVAILIIALLQIFCLLG